MALGVGSGYTLWVVDQNNVIGHYDWSYGYDEWWPRKSLDAFSTETKDKCSMYKGRWLTFILKWKFGSAATESLENFFCLPAEAFCVGMAPALFAERLLH